MVKHVHIDPAHPQVTVAGVPGVPDPPGSVDAACARCEKAVKIAPNTQRLLWDYPDIPLLCWECLKILLPEYVNERPIFTGMNDGRRILGQPRKQDNN